MKIRARMYVYVRVSLCAWMCACLCALVRVFLCRRVIACVCVAFVFAYL